MNKFEIVDTCDMLQVLGFDFKKFRILVPQSRKSYIFILYKMLLKCQQTVAYKVSKTKL